MNVTQKQREGCEMWHPSACSQEGALWCYSAQEKKNTRAERI